MILLIWFLLAKHDDLPACFGEYPMDGNEKKKRGRGRSKIRMIYNKLIV